MSESDREREREKDTREKSLTWLAGWLAAILSVTSGRSYCAHLDSRVSPLAFCCSPCFGRTMSAATAAVAAAAAPATSGSVRLAEKSLPKVSVCVHRLDQRSSSLQPSSRHSLQAISMRKDHTHTDTLTHSLIHIHIHIMLAFKSSNGELDNWVRSKPMAER